MYSNFDIFFFFQPTVLQSLMMTVLLFFKNFYSHHVFDNKEICQKARFYVENKFEKLFAFLERSLLEFRSSFELLSLLLSLLWFFEPRYNSFFSLLHKFCFVLSFNSKLNAIFPSLLFSVVVTSEIII